MSGDRLAGKATMITGAGSGLGRGAALRFAAEGAAVACVDRNGAAAKEVAEEITVAGGRAVAFEADVTDEESIAAAFAAAAEQLGGVDAVYANAGIQIVGEAADTPIEDWHKVIAVNLTGVFLTGKYALKQMISQGTGGSIINQASVAALFGSKAGAAYAAAKGGVISLSRQMAVDYGAHGIRVNAVCPGTVWTPLVDATYAARAALYGVEAEVSKGATATRAPLGRLGEPVDIANMALFLASDDSTWVTGGTFVVDGGFTAA